MPDRKYYNKAEIYWFFYKKNSKLQFRGIIPQEMNRPQNRSSNNSHIPILLGWCLPSYVYLPGTFEICEIHSREGGSSSRYSISSLQERTSILCSYQSHFPAGTVWYRQYHTEPCFNDNGWVGFQNKGLIIALLP